MGNEITKIMTGLYVGDYQDARDCDQLKRHGITHILSIHNDAKDKIFDHIRYMCIDASDEPQVNLAKHFSACNNFIHSGRSGGGNVLIHCKAGRSRSVTILLAYLMTVTPLSFGDAYRVVLSNRASIKPNKGFQSQLKDFQNYGVMTEKRRLRAAFRNPRQDAADHAEGVWLVNKRKYVRNCHT